MGQLASGPSGDGGGIGPSVLLDPNILVMMSQTKVTRVTAAAEGPPPLVFFLGSCSGWRVINENEEVTQARSWLGSADTVRIQQLVC